jgi:putative transposase
MAKKACAKDGKLIRNTTLKLRLHPTTEQAALLDKTFGCCRYLWNEMLAD